MKTNTQYTTTSGPNQEWTEEHSMVSEGSVSPPHAHRYDAHLVPGSGGLAVHNLPRGTHALVLLVVLQFQQEGVASLAQLPYGFLLYVHVHHGVTGLSGGGLVPPDCEREREREREREIRI